jgi:hypothetical protein
MVNLIEVMDNAAEYIQNTWIAVVRGDNQIPGAPALRFDTITQRNLYADSIIQGRGIDIPEAGDFSRKILATDKIAEKTEEGYERWDMKPMLLGGPKTRVSKKGIKYNIIPFRHGTGDKSGDNAQFKPMPKDIYAAAKALKPSISNGIKTKYGENLNTKDHLMLLSKHQGKVSHKSLSIYEGMYKIQATYAKAAQNQYLTFRIVSDKSDPLSWWHPGRAAQPHVQFVVDYCMPAIERNLKEAAQRDFLVFQGVGMEVTVN